MVGGHMEQRRAEACIGRQGFPAQHLVQLDGIAERAISEGTTEAIRPLSYRFFTSNYQLSVLHFLFDPIIFVASKVFDALDLMH